ncbi:MULTISPECIES: cytochrome c oxidase subunit II [unclassified Chelatococcus]|uniref:cytochrome c oxidase subunit II n=1 Tax=unclassified Chelatococcus TaxID=2638111 RepID=UPI001BCC6574|nr:MULTISPECIES: cytochrome c oxidase subunit II [unclassified Chelatococcus]MBS7700022.1 cytochrome c oxidase subunit II [Chelatococcus sp. YT9]MBX3556715.1 cytochrome c oxidase subunit II [Chelatococcus sp.]
MKRPALVLAMLALALAGCNDLQSALSPHGPAADELTRLIWLFTAICAVVWALVMIVLMVALSRTRPERADPLALPAGQERAAMRAVIAAAGVTAVVMVSLTVLSFFANRTLASIGANAMLTIRVIGHQWWWEVRYENAQPSQTMTTANEIHIPAGEPVKLVLQSDDVIHSFWVPALHGKLDLVPGMINTLTLKADKPGVYRGQCAEFCGMQHAHMALLVVAEPRPAFEGWYAAQLKDAAEPISAEQRSGRTLFLSKSCVMCHRIQGTPAGATSGPDLTHLGSRTTLAAGTLPLSHGNLAAWIADPQGVKPGAKMPVTDLSGDELNAIVAYLESLK